MLRIKTFRISLGAVLATTAMGASAAHAADRFVDKIGADTTDCSNSATPCETIPYAIGQAAAGDTIHVAAGTYTPSDPSEVLTVDKTLTFLGQQHGVDARTRVSAAEAILAAPGGVYVAASGVVFDGFTIQDSTNQAVTGFGIYLAAGVDGTWIVNNIFQDNISGLGLSNVGKTQAVIQHNRFQNNNVLGLNWGSGIYTDHDVGGAVANVRIEGNLFAGQSFAAVTFRNVDAATPDSNITISNNTMDECLHGVVLYNAHGAMVTNNTVTNTRSDEPPLGAIATAIGIYGGDRDVTIENNRLETGRGYGLRIVNFFEPNSDIQIHGNNIVGFELAGLHVDDAPAGPDDYATCNWWGDVSGPTHPTLNPDGRGDAVSGDSLLAANFNPWLTAAAPNGLCGQPTPPCCETDGGITYGAELGDAGCILCTDAGSSKDAGSDASTDGMNNLANGSDHAAQDPQGSGDDNPAASPGKGASDSGGGCQMGTGTSSLAMAATLLAMTVAGAARRRRKAMSS